MNELAPSRFELSQNYPDPFIEYTTIKYCLPEKTNIRLELFDQCGRKVKVLADEIKESGTYMVKLSAKGLNEGIYLYRLTANDFEETRRLHLLR